MHYFTHSKFGIWADAPLRAVWERYQKPENAHEGSNNFLRKKGT